MTPPLSGGRRETSGDLLPSTLPTPLLVERGFRVNERVSEWIIHPRRRYVPKPGVAKIVAVQVLSRI